MDGERKILSRGDGFQKRSSRKAGADQSLRENFARDLELQRFLRIDRRNDCIGRKAEGIQIFAKAGREKIIRTRCRASAQSIDPNTGEGGSLATRSRPMRGMRLNEEPSLRSRHSVFKRWEQPDRRECSIALREAQP